jgi:hypothetical protein
MSSETPHEHAEDHEGRSSDMDRRNFLKNAALMAGGALAGLLGVSSAQAQPRPPIKVKPKLPNINLKVGDQQPASREEFITVFKMIKKDAGGEEEFMDAKVNEAWKEAAGRLNSVSRAGGLAVLELSLRTANMAGGEASYGVGLRLGQLYEVLDAGMKANPESPVAIGNGCGTGCGNGCGTGCMAAMGGGVHCGFGCEGGGEDYPGGVFCGGGCSGPAANEFMFDDQGIVMEGVNIERADMGVMSQAMKNAGAAYDKVFA